MSSLKRTVELIVGKFSLPENMLERIRMARERRDKAKRVSVAVFAIVLFASVATFAANAFGLFSPDLEASGQQPPEGTAPTSQITEPPSDCPTGAARGELAIDSTSGQPGTHVTVSGPRPLFDQVGEYHPATVQIWWNVDPSSWPLLTPGSGVSPSPAGPGDIVLLGESSEPTCTFAIDVVTPDVPPGLYPILVVDVSLDPSGNSASQLGFWSFEVTG